MGQEQGKGDNMIKVIALIYKKSGLTDAEFSRYWRETHGPLAAKVIPGLRTYIQNHVVKLPGVTYEGDGFVEIWFDNMEAYDRYMTWRQSDDAKVLRDDEDAFIDRSRIMRYVVEEHVIVT
jgi:uncharacterized protein (TIGR02118 family)